MTTPVIVVDGAVIVGFDSAKIDKYAVDRDPGLNRSYRRFCMARLQRAGAAGTVILTLMIFVLKTPAQETIRRIQRIQTVTICRMTVETAVSLAAAWMARSPALLAFGGDSAIELLSAIVVLWRFRAHAVQEESETLARENHSGAVVHACGLLWPWFL